MYEGETHFRKLLLKQIVFGAFYRGDLDLRPIDIKINMVHLLPKTDV